MANIKIGDLVTIGDPISTDVLPIVDVSADTTNKISIEELLKNAAAGTAAAPAFAFDADPNTGMYRSSADALAFSTGGTGRLFIDSSGNVGINNTSPLYPLDVKSTSGDAWMRLDSAGSTSNSGYRFAHAGTNHFVIYHDGSNDSLAFYNNVTATQPLTLTNAGRLGVGTSSPSARLHVSGGDSVFGSTNLFRIFSTGQTVDFVNAAQTAYVSGRVNGHDLKFYTNTGAGIDIDSSGRVGIKTSAPSYALDISSTDANALRIRGTADNPLIMDATDSGPSYVSVQRAGTRVAYYGFGGSGNDFNLINETSTGGITLGTNSTTRLQILSSGNVGIGLSPTAKLHVGGTIQSSVGSHTAQMYSDGGAAFFTSVGAYPSVFYTNGSERLRIDSSGRLGVGTSSPSTKLQFGTSEDAISWASGNGIVEAPNNLYLRSVGGSGDVLLQTSGGNVGIGTTSATAKLNVEDDTGSLGSTQDITAEFKRLDGTYNPRLQIRHSTTGTDLHHTWSTTAANLTFSIGSAEALRIDSSGNVGIGTSAPGNFDNEANNLVVGDGSGDNGITIFTGSAVGDFGSIFFADSSSGGAAKKGQIRYEQNNEVMSFYTNESERLRIDLNGNVGIGTSAALSSAGFTGITTSGSTGGIYWLAKAGAQKGYLYGQDNDVTLASTDASGVIRLLTGGNNERCRIDSSGRLLVGTSSSRIVEDLQGNGPQGLIQIEATNSDAIMSIISAGTADAGRAGTLNLGRHRNSTVGGTPTVVQSGDTLGAICFAGGDGTDMRTKGASIACQVDGTPGSNDMPGRLVLSTTADGASSPTERLRIDSSGNVGIGTGSVASGGVNSKNLNLHTDAAASVFLKLSNSSTGNNSSDGFDLAADSSGNAYVINRENASMRFFTNDTERMRIDSSGRLLVGTSSSLGNDATLQTSGQQVNYQAFHHQTAQAGPFIILSKSNGTQASPTAVTHNDYLGILGFSGYDGTDYATRGAEIACQVDSTPGSNDMPGRLVFSTTADGSASPTERMRITSSSQVWINTTTGTVNTTNFGTNIGLILNHARNTDGGNAVAQFYGTAGTARIMGDGDLQNTNNSYGAISDIKLKENIVNANSQWNDLKTLQIRNYNFKPETGYSTHTQIGVVAQEVETVSPGLVTESPDLDEEGNDLGTTTKSVNYSVLYMKAVKALQEAMERIETLEQRLTDAGL